MAVSQINDNKAAIDQKNRNERVQIQTAVNQSKNLLLACRPMGCRRFGVQPNVDKFADLEPTTCVKFEDTVLPAL